MTRALVTQLVDALEAMETLFACHGKDSTALIWIDKSRAAITAAREYLETEPKPTLKEALAQQGIKLRTEFEPKKWDGDRSHLRFGGCPACGKRSCIARSCTTNEPTTRPLTLQERAEMESAGVTGELVKVLAFNDRPKAEPSGERAELIARLAKQWAELDPADPYRADVGQAVSMLEADAQQAKRVPMTDDQIQEIYIRTYNVGHHGRDFENAFARAIEAHHGIGGEV